MSKELKLFGCFVGHKWGPWTNPVVVNFMIGGQGLIQYHTCKRCGKMVRREV